MKKMNLLCVLSMAALLLTSSAFAADIKVGVVDFKKCVENSKLGKQEQGNFEAMKSQMESVLGEKEKELTSLTSKLQDPDYLDSISADAETELKRKYRTQSQEFGQIQQQYYQVLQQANFKVIQQLQEEITKASDVVAKNGGYDLILNSETSFFTSPTLDVTDALVTELDKTFVASNDETEENAQLKAMFPGK